MRIAAYVRVSTDHQREKGYSVGEQTERIKSYCKAREWELKKIYTDAGYSGKSLDRPAMRQLIEDCELYDLILVNKLDRLSRSQKDTLYLIEDVFNAKGIKFASMYENFDTSTPLGIAMLGIMSVFAQLEREQIKERMNMGRDARAKKGMWRGGGNVPYGYDYVGEGLLVPNETAPVIRKMFEMYRNGYTLNQIQTVANNESGICNRLASVTDVLTNPLYIGKMRWKGEIIDGIQEPLVSQELFDAVQLRHAQITQSLPDVNKRPFKSTHLLSGFLFCGECGSRYCVVGSQSKVKHKYYIYYGCARKRRKNINYRSIPCHNITYREDKLDKIITDAILSLDFDNITIEEKPKAVDYSKEIAKIEAKKDRLIDLYTENGIDKDSLTKKMEELNKRQEKLKSLQKPVKKADKGRIIKVKENVAEILSSGDMDAKRRVFDALISKVVIDHENIDIHWAF